MRPRWITRIGLCLVAGLLAAPSARADDLPADLTLIPGDAAGFLRVDVKAVLDSPLCDEVRFALAGLKPGEYAAFARAFPFDPMTVERVAVIFPTTATALDPVPDLHPTAVSALAVLSCSKPFDREAVLKSAYTAGRPKSYRGWVYQFDEDTWSGVLVLPDNRTVVVGAEDSLVWLIDRMAPGAAAGPLSPARAEAVGHTLFAAVNPRAVVPPGAPLPPDLRPLAEAQRVCLAVDLGKTAAVSLRLHYADAAKAEAGEKAVRVAIGMGRGQLRELEAKLKGVAERPSPAGRPVGPSELPERFAGLLGLGAVRRVDQALEALPVERQGTTVRVAAEWSVPHTGALAVGLAAVTTLGTTANSTFQFVGNSIRPPGGPGGPAPEEIRLKKLAAAFEAYHAAHGHYPPAATIGKDGTPLLSWRVALLPYLGERELFAQFRQDEPWDSLHNKRLIEKMPAVFNKPHVYPKNYGKTNAKVVTGPGTLFDGRVGVKKVAGERVVLAVESGDGGPVYWTKPADLTYVPGKPPPMFGPYGYSCWAVFTDGSARSLNKQADEKQLPALLTRPRTGR
jgi:hypothetical protein